MKLNNECIRAVMLKIEEVQEFSLNDDGLIERDYLTLETLCEDLPDHSKEDIFYSLYNLEQAGYVNMSVQWASGGVVYHCVINYMTFAGHEFLDRIRDPKHWSIIKGGLSAVRNYSLDAINAIAGGVTSAAISAYLEKNPLL